MIKHNSENNQIDKYIECQPKYLLFISNEDNIKCKRLTLQWNSK